MCQGGLLDGGVGGERAEHDVAAQAGGWGWISKAPTYVDGFAPEELGVGWVVEHGCAETGEGAVDKGIEAIVGGDEGD